MDDWNLLLWAMLILGAALAYNRHRQRPRREDPPEGENESKLIPAITLLLFAAALLAVPFVDREILGFVVGFSVIVVGPLLYYFFRGVGVGERMGQSEDGEQRKGDLE